MLIATVQKIENLPAFALAGADAAVIGLEHFALAASNEVRLDEVQDWKQACDQCGLKLFINMRSMIHEDQLEAAKDALEKIQGLCDGIYYGDEGLYYLAAKNGMADLLIYQPETLVTNAMDAAYYLSLGIQSVSLAHELSLAEILSIAGKQKNVEVLVQGYYSLMYSRRPLVSNYLRVIHRDSSLQNLSIQEQTRQNKMPVLQSEKGTLVFSDAPKSSYAQMQDLMKAGINRFRIEGLFESDEKVLEWLKDYKMLMAGQALDSKEGSDVWYHQSSLKRKED